MEPNRNFAETKQEISSIVVKEGVKVGNYEIKELLGAGGMGAVYKAMDAGLNRIVAIKFVLASGGRRHERMLKRFLKEAEICARLTHPNIVKVFHAGTYCDNPYLVMEYVEGMRLTSYVKERNIDRKGRMQLLVDVARAVHYAHSMGIIHRDIKPSNIMVRNEGSPVLMDFGIARMLQDQEKRLTQTGELMGSPNYMSPEQLESRKKEIDERADIYGLGAVMYQLLTDRPPFEEGSLIELICQVACVPPVPPRKWVPDLPEALEEICMTCLEKSKENRYASAEILVSKISRYLEGKDEGFGKSYIRRKNIRAAQRYYHINKRKFFGAVLAMGSIIGLSFFGWHWSVWEKEAQVKAMEGYRQGMQLYEQKNYKEAASMLQQAVEKGKGIQEDPLLHLYLAICRERLGQAQQARLAYEKAYRYGPANLQIARHMANFYLAQKEYDKALLLLERCLQEKTDDPSLYRERATAYAGLSRDEKAKQDRGKADFLEAQEHAKKASVHEKNQELHQALESISRAIELYPSAAYCFQKGKWLMQAGYHEEAYRHFDLAFQKEKSREIEMELAYAAEKIQEYEIAYRHIRVLYESERLPRWSLKLGVLAFHKNDYKETMKYLREALSSGKMDREQAAEAFYYQGLALEKRGREREAEKIFKKAFEAGSPRLDIVLRLATHCFRQEKIEEALVYLEKGDALLQGKVLTEESLTLCSLLAECYLKTKRFQKAGECFSRCIHLKPWEYASYFKRGICHLQNGQFEEAERDFTLCIKLKPEEFAPHIHLMESIFNQGVLDNFFKLHSFLRLVTKVRPTSFHSNLFLEELESKPILFTRAEGLSPWNESQEKKYGIFLKGLVETEFKSVNQMAEVAILAMHEYPEVFDRLSERMERPIGPIAKQRVQSLLERIAAKWENRFVQYLVRHYHTYDEDALKEMYHKGKLATFCLMKILKNSKQKGPIRFFAAKALVDLKTYDAHERLQEAADDEDAVVSLLCRAAGSEIGLGKISVKTLTTAMKSEDPFVRSLLAQSASLENESLLETLLKDQEIKVRLYAAQRLLATGNPEAEQELFNGISHPNSTIRCFCIFHYWNMKHAKNDALRDKIKKNLPLLIRCTQDENPQVRRTAIAHLANMKREEDNAILEKHANDPDELTRLNALMFLCQRGKNDIPFNILLNSKENIITRGVVAASIYSNLDSNPTNVPYLYLLKVIGILEKDPEEKIKLLVFIALGWIHQEISHKMVLQKSRYPDEAVRMGCIISMSNLKNLFFLPRLKEMLDDEYSNVREFAANTIIDIVGNNHNDLSALVPWEKRFQSDPRPEIRKGAGLGYARLVYQQIPHPDQSNETRWDGQIMYDHFLKRLVQKAEKMNWEGTSRYNGLHHLKEYLDFLSLSLEFYPNQAKVLFELGVLHYIAAGRREGYRIEHCKKGIECIQKALSIKPRNFYRKWLALLYFRNGEHRKSLFEAMQLLVEFPWDEEIWMLKGKSEEALGNSNQARKDIRYADYLKERKNRISSEK